MRPAASSLLLVVGLFATVWVPTTVGDPQLTVTDSPDVVVANDPETMRDDPDTEQREFNPKYVFSAQARVSNDAEQRDVQAEAIVYPAQDVEEDCPRDRQAFPVSFVFKRLNLSAGEQRDFGGSADGQDAQGDEYWPMAIAKTYRNARTGDNVSIEEGEHTFCTAIRTTGEDPACDRDANRTCVLATAPFQSYVRRENAAPAVTSMSANPENPRPGQRTLLEAEAIDNSTDPREDTLTYEWNLEGRTVQGASVQHEFGTEGVHEVEVTVSDGFDEESRTLQVPVGDVSLDEDPQTSPVAGWLASAVLIAFAARLRSRA
jgi:hypothetical protein